MIEQETQRRVRRGHDIESSGAADYQADLLHRRDVKTLKRFHKFTYSQSTSSRSAQKRHKAFNTVTAQLVGLGKALIFSDEFRMSEKVVLRPFEWSEREYSNENNVASRGKRRTERNIHTMPVRYQRSVNSKWRRVKSCSCGFKCFFFGRCIAPFNRREYDCRLFSNSSSVESISEFPLKRETLSATLVHEMTWLARNHPWNGTIRRAGIGRIANAPKILRAGRARDDFFSARTLHYLLVVEFLHPETMFIPRPGCVSVASRLQDSFGEGGDFRFLS